jgi:hypothetical protein
MDGRAHPTWPRWTNDDYYAVKALIREAALAKTPAPRTPDDGTLTNCPLDGVHEHAFRGPHTFREWDPGTTPGDIAGSGERLGLLDIVDRCRQHIAALGADLSTIKAREVTSTQRDMAADRAYNHLRGIDRILTDALAAPTTEGPRAPVGELDVERLARAMHAAEDRSELAWEARSFEDTAPDIAREYAALPEAAHEYEKWAEGPQTEDHAPFCDYRARKPAIRKDCDCGAFRQWTAEANDAADHLARLVLEADLVGSGTRCPDCGLTGTEIGRIHIRAQRAVSEEDPNPRPCPACGAMLAYNETHWSLGPAPMGGYICPADE